MIDRQVRTQLYLKYSKASQLPLMVLALLMIPLLLAPELFELTTNQLNFIDDLDWFIYACFATDFVIKIYLAPSIREHLRDNWLDVVIVALPLLRPLRLLQSARLLRLLRAMRLVVFAAEGTSKLKSILARRGFSTVLGITMVVVVLCAALVYAFERSEEGTIQSFGDALWWALATVTTVGYGDAVPHTPEGRGIAIFLMLAGIAFYSILTANIAAFFVGADDEHANKDMELKLDLILRRLDLIEASMNAPAREDGGSNDPENKELSS